MKIEKISFSNLNSLYGSWEIDLNHPEYQASGIFAIVGDTGAGKSSILDAVCLALYGRTPRLENINQSGNEIMSRQSGHCRAELSFLVKGKRYRAAWSQRRARQRADGRLQPGKHILVEVGPDTETDRIIEDKVSKVPAAVEKLCGMDFERFTRTMLLAQGDFAAFLQAKHNERAEILEKITGTKLYRKISVEAFNRYREKNVELQRLEAQIGAVTLLGPEELEQLQRKQADLEKKLPALEIEIKTVEAACQWYQIGKKLEQEKENLTAEAQELQQILQEFEPRRQRLNAALRANELAVEHAELQAQRRQKEREETQLRENQEALPALQNEAQEAENERLQCEKQLETLKNQLEKLRPRLRDAREKDIQIRDRQSQVAAAEERTTEIRLGLESETMRQKTLLQNKSKLENKLEDTAQALQDCEADQTLLNGGLERLLALLEVLQEAEQRLKLAKEKLLQKKTEHQKAEKKKGVAAQAHLEAGTRLEALNNELSQAEEAINALLAGIPLREHKDQLEALREKDGLRRLQLSLDKQREELKDGQPCPLCGALEHPYAEGNVPSMDEIETELKAKIKLIEEIERKQESREKTREKRDAALASQRESQNQQHRAELGLGEAKQALESAERDSQRIQEEHNKAEENIARVLLPLGLADMLAQEFDALPRLLHERRDKRAQLLEEQVSMASQLTALNGQINTIEQLCLVKSQSLQSAEKEQQALQQGLEELKQQRKDIFGDQDPEREERRRAQEIDKAGEMLQRWQQQSTALANEQRQCEQNIARLQQALEELCAQLGQAGSAFDAALQNMGFADEAQYAQSLLTAEERTALSQEKETLNARDITLRSRMQANLEALAGHREGLQPEQDEAGLNQRLAELKETRSQLNQSLGGIKQGLQQDQIARQGRLVQLELQEKQNLELQDWRALNDLIGSADGQKYVAFAQGLTFDVLINHANRKLQELNKRYFLKRGQERLELDVIDTYLGDELRSTNQGGELRTSKNLSGGESFIVSLALALGLAEMVSENVQVDSLFLDEGFGSLDEETLDTALTTLATLRQESKLIGLISHVPSVKERIGCQIQVIKRAGGRSVLKGPGCRKLKEAE
ncbi:MAG: AAA family ATPase [Lentisphaeria bacterium]